MDQPPFKQEPESKPDKETIKTEHPENHLILSTNTNQSIHTFLYSIVKRGVLISPGNISCIKLMEDEALHLCGMMKKEGFFDGSTNESCVICATEKLEKDLIQTMRNQLEIVKMARKFYTQPENRLKYNVCANHRPSYASMADNKPRCSVPPGFETQYENKENVPVPESHFSYFTQPNENVNVPPPQNSDAEFASNAPKSNPTADFINSYFDTPILDSTPLILPEFETITLRSKFFPHITQEVNVNSVEYLQNCVFAPPVMMGHVPSPYPPQDFFSRSPGAQNSPSFVPNPMPNGPNVGPNMPSNYGNNFTPISVPSAPPLFHNPGDINLANMIPNTMGNNLPLNRNVSPNFPNVFETRNVVQDNLNLPNVHTSQQMNMPLRQNIIQQTVDIIAGDLNNALGNRGRKILGKKY